jgi:hypothetical protein
MHSGGGGVVHSRVETVYRLSIVGTRECYIGRTTLPLAKRLALHMLDDCGKARWMWMQKARLAGHRLEIAILEETPPQSGHQAEDRQIRQHRRAGWIVMNERRAHQRDPHKAFLRFATRVLDNLWRPAGFVLSAIFVMLL